VRRSRLLPTRPITCDQDHGYTAEQLGADRGAEDAYPKNTGANLTLANCLKGITVIGKPEPLPPGGRTNKVVMDYYDGNTVTGLWDYAQHFAMSDNSYGTTYGPSTPGALNVTGAQTYGAVCGPSLALGGNNIGAALTKAVSPGAGSRAASTTVSCPAMASARPPRRCAPSRIRTPPRCSWWTRSPAGQEHPEMVLDKLVEVVRATGRIGVAGAYNPQDPGAATENAGQGRYGFNYGLVFDKAISMGHGQCPVKRYNHQLRDLIIRGRGHPSLIVSHELPLDQAPDAYQQFDRRADGWSKVLLHPAA
jgi:hypothetical protein